MSRIDASFLVCPACLPAEGPALSAVEGLRRLQVYLPAEGGGLHRPESLAGYHPDVLTGHRPDIIPMFLRDFLAGGQGKTLIPLIKKKKICVFLRSSASGF